MIQNETLVKITDNAGGTVGTVFKILGSSKKRYATLGEVVIISVKVASPRKAVKKKDVVKVLVVRTKSALRRKDGSYVRFDENAVVLIDAKKEPTATRIFGPLPRELKEKGFEKLMTMAEEIV